MSDGLFDTFGVDADQVEVPTGGPKPGTYEATISNAEIVIGTKSDSTAVNLVISYQIPNYEYPQKEYFGLPKSKAPWDDVTVISETNGRKNTEKSVNEFKLGLLKKRLLALGVPESKVNSVKPADLIGAPVVLTLVQNKDYVNIARNNGVVAKQDSAETVLPVPEAPPADYKPAWG